MAMCLGGVYRVCGDSGDCPSICCAVDLGLGFMKGLTVHRVFPQYNFI